MANLRTRILSAALSVVMVCTLLPVSVLAEDSLETQPGMEGSSAAIQSSDDLEAPTGTETPVQGPDDLEAPTGTETPVQGPDDLETPTGTEPPVQGPDGQESPTGTEPPVQGPDGQEPPTGTEPPVQGPDGQETPTGTEPPVQSPDNLGLPTGTEPTVLESVTFDISKGSVIAGESGITGVVQDKMYQETILWEQIDGSTELIVTGTSGSTHHVKLADDCPQDVTLTLKKVSITTDDADKNYSTVCNLAEDTTLTLRLVGDNTLAAGGSGRLLWTWPGSTIRFKGGTGSSLELKKPNDGISAMYSGNGTQVNQGTFEFQDCTVTLDSRWNFEEGNSVASGKAVISLLGTTSFTVGDETYSSTENLLGENIDENGQVTINMSNVTSDVTLGSRDGYTYDNGTWTLAYGNLDPSYRIIGYSDQYRLVISDPGVEVTLEDLTIERSNVSALLLKNTDPSVWEEDPLTIEVKGTVTLSSGSGITLNTNEAEKGKPMASVRVEGVEGTSPKLIIEQGSQKNSVGVNLTAEGLAVQIEGDCMSDVTAGADSLVYVAGNIAGKGTERDEGQLFRGTFQGEFISQGKSFRLTEKDDGTFALLLPGSADLKRVTLDYDAGNWIVTGIDESGFLAPNESGNVSLTVSPTDEAITAGVPEGEKTMSFQMMKGSKQLPAVYLEITEGSMAAVDADKDHDTKAKGKVDLLGALGLTGMEMEIKGRGNASWTYPKKSYQIKLDKKRDVLDMGESKKWILLPSYEDNSRVRSAVGFHLAQELGAEFSCEWEYVDLYIDGQYWGLYIICEKVEIGENRIDITNIDDVLEETIGEDNYLSNAEGVTYNEDFSIATVLDEEGNEVNIDLTGGYHLEFDNNLDPLQFGAGVDHTNGGDNIKMITVKEPEYLGKHPETDKSFTYICKFMDAADEALYTGDEDELRKYIDLESFAQLFILRDYTFDWDATDNLHIWKESDYTGDGRIHAGPAWDFDNSLGRATGDPSSQRIKEEHADKESQKKDAGDYNAKWLAQLLRHPAFQEELARQYQLHEKLFKCCKSCQCNWTGFDDVAALTGCGDTTCGCYLHDFIAQQAQKIDASAQMDQLRWSEKAEFEEDVARVQAFTCERNTYLANRIGEFDVTLYEVTFKDGDQTVDTQLAGSTGIQNLPQLTKEGYTFEGWFYQYGEELKKFTPGSNVVGNLTVTARWTRNGKPHEVLVLNSGKGGTASVNVQSVYAGDPVRIRLTVDEGYRLQSLTAVNDADEPVVLTKMPDDSYTFTMPDSAVTVTAVWAEITVTHAITVVGSGNYGSVSVVPSQAAAGDTVTVAVAPSAGYRLQSLTAVDATGTALTLVNQANGSYTFTMPDSSVTVTASWTRKTSSGGGGGGNNDPSYTVTVDNQSENGSVKTDTRAASEGDTVSITVKPEEGYQLESLTVTDGDGKELKLTRQKDGTYTFRMPDSKVVVEATFTKAEPKPLPFRDVGENTWYTDAVRFVYENGLMTGTESDTFEPNGIMTRAMIWTVLAANEGVDTSSSLVWYEAGQRWAMNNGVSDGTEPNDPITREQLAVMLWRCAGSPKSSGDLSRFADASSVSSWAVDAMVWAVNQGLFSGVGGNLLAPQTPATRAQTAVIFTQFVSLTER